MDVGKEYLYAYFGDTEKAQYWVERLAKQAFDAGEAGYPGDEDNGSMSGWYVFAVMGLYPLCPGKAEYIKVPGLAGTVKINGKKMADYTGQSPVVSHFDLLCRSVDSGRTYYR